MTTSLWRSPYTAAETVNTDVSIVGAGLTGLSVAYWLKELAPQLRVTIVDRADVGAGASGRNAGFVTAGSASYLATLVKHEGLARAAEYWETKQRGIALMKERLLKSSPGLEYSAGGSVTLYRDDALLQETLAMLGTFVAPVPGADLVAQGLGDFVGGLQVASDGAVHPLKLLQSMKAELQSRGVVFITDQSVGWIEGTELVLERQRLQSKKIFLCVNGYAGQLSPELGAIVQPKRAQMLALDGAGLKIVGNFYDPARRVYFRRHQDGTLLIGGLRLLDEEAENSDFDKVTRVIQAALEKYAQGLGASRVLARWSGTMGFTKDEKPVICDVPGQSGVTFIGGYSGHGMGMAFALARRAVQGHLA